MFSPIPIPSGQELPRVSTSVPGPRAAALCDLLADVECPALTARRKRRAERAGAPYDPIVWSAARGANVVDVDGNVYIDLTAGFGAALVGHGHPAVVAAVQTQAGKLIHALGDVYPSEQKIALEARLATLAPWSGARVILGLSGSDAIEAALKTAVLATGRPGIVAFEGGYHGLSHGPLAACGYSLAFRAPFRLQLNPHVYFVPYPTQQRPETIARTLHAVEEIVSHDNVGAVLIEPILGRGGVLAADPMAVGTIVEMAHRAGALVIADEIYTGLRRASSGWCYSSDHWPSTPDIVCLGKALGGTLPVSACLIRPDVAAAWGDPQGEAIHTSTFLGNPLACAAALATLDVLSHPDTVNQLETTARSLWQMVLEPMAEDPAAGVLELGGAKLLAGLHLHGGTRRALAVVRALLERGYIVLTGGTQGDWLVLTPPLTLTREQIAHFRDTLRDVLHRIR